MRHMFLSERLFCVGTASVLAVGLGGFIVSLLVLAICYAILR